jgi:hypothetical protein
MVAAIVLLLVFLLYLYFQPSDTNMQISYKHVFGSRQKIIQNLIKFKYDSKFVFHLKISSCKLGLVKQSKKRGARNDTHSDKGCA